VATLQGAPLLRAEEVVTVRLLNESLQGSKVSIETATGLTGRCLLPLLGRHQVHNLAVAVTVMHVLTEINAVDAEPAVWFKGIEAVSWPARLQRLRDDPPVILDGAHNPHAAEVLADFIRRLLKPRPVGLIFGMCADKDVDGFLARVAPLLDRLWVVPVPDERNMPLKRVLSAARMAGLNSKTVTAELAPAYDESVAWAQGAGGAVCIAGSLFLAAAVLAMGDHHK
jgi:dihydrofolate synthase/folylpolyglutamate synthase